MSSEFDDDMELGGAQYEHDMSGRDSMNPYHTSDADGHEPDDGYGYPYNDTAGQDDEVYDEEADETAHHGYYDGGDDGSAQGDAEPHLMHGSPYGPDDEDEDADTHNYDQPMHGLNHDDLEAARAERRRSAIQKGLDMAKQQEGAYDEEEHPDEHSKFTQYGMEDDFGDDELAQLDEIEGRGPRRSVQMDSEDYDFNNQTGGGDYNEMDNSYGIEGEAEDGLRTTEQDLRDALAERQALRRTHALRQRKILQLWARDPNLQRTLQSLADGRDGLLIPGYEDLDSTGNVGLDSVGESSALGSTEPLQKLYHDKLDKLSRAWDQLDQRREQADATIDKLTSILDRHDERLVKLTDTFRLFKRATATEATHSATQRKIDMQVLLSLEEREQKVDRDLAEARLRFINVTNYLTKLERSIKQKEELAGGLHAIDFEQLRVENATLHDQIEERSDHLHKLRKKTVATVQVLTHVREKLHFVRQKNKELAASLEGGNSDVGTLRDRVGKAKQLRDQLRADNAVLKQKQGFIGSDRLVHDFESRKADLVVVKNKVEALKARYRELHNFVLAANAEIGRANGTGPSSASNAPATGLNGSLNRSRGGNMPGVNGATIKLPNVRR